MDDSSVVKHNEIYMLCLPEPRSSCFRSPGRPATPGLQTRQRPVRGRTGDEKRQEHIRTGRPKRDWHSMSL